MPILARAGMPLGPNGAKACHHWTGQPGKACLEGRDIRRLTLAKDYQSSRMSLEFVGKPDHLLSLLPVCIECRRGFCVSNPSLDFGNCGFNALDFTQEYGTFLV